MSRLDVGPKSPHQEIRERTATSPADKIAASAPATIPATRPVKAHNPLYLKGVVSFPANFRQGETILSLSQDGSQAIMANGTEGVTLWDIATGKALPWKDPDGLRHRNARSGQRAGEDRVQTHR